jgi:hypothetical protein
MKKLALVGCLVSAIAFAADKPAAAAPEAGKNPMDMMMSMGWTPRKVTKEDKKAVTDAMEADHKAWMAGNMDEVVSNRDFPLFMMTDDKDGKVMTNMAEAAAWKKMMEPSMKGMMENKDMMAAMAKMPKPKTDVFFVTDTMALASTKMTMPVGKEKHEMRNAMLMVLVDGKWKVKGEIEGGWGDMAKKQMEEMKKAETKPMAPAGTPPKGMK